MAKRLSYEVKEAMVGSPALASGSGAGSIASLTPVACLNRYEPDTRASRSTNTI